MGAFPQLSGWMPSGPVSASVDVGSRSDAEHGLLELADHHAPENPAGGVVVTETSPGRQSVDIPGCEWSFETWGEPSAGGERPAHWWSAGWLPVRAWVELVDEDESDVTDEA